jgi:hypothetical protein
MSKLSECDLPFRSVEIEGRHCVLELDQKRKGRFRHIASFYDADLAAHYVGLRNGDADPLPRELRWPTEEERIDDKIEPRTTKPPLVLTIADAEKELNDTDRLVLEILRSQLNGSDTVAISQGDIRRTAAKKGQTIHSGSVNHSLRKLMRLGLIMPSQPSIGHNPAVYQIARDRLINV